MLRGFTAIMIAASLSACTATSFEDALSPEDQSHMAATMQVALESRKTGEGEVWENPLTGRRGTITPLRTWTADDGRACRKYQALVTIDNSTRASYGKACRTAAEIWVDIRSPTPYARPGVAADNRPGATFGLGFGHHFGYHSFGLHHGHIFDPFPYWPYYRY